MMKIFCWAGLLSTFFQGAFSQGGEEWSGPLAGWANVRTRFGARGDGHTDDTRALQLALDSLSCLPTGFSLGAQRYTVVYLPAGTYCISSTLRLRGKIGVNFIGEDPERTIIDWTGPENDTLFWANGSAYFKIARIGWDANGRKGMEALGIHWKDKWNQGNSRSFASLNIELSDLIFRGGFQYGVSGGTASSGGTGWNDSEVTIKRCLFQSCSGAGIEIHGYNALDYWIWDCRFLQCGYGILCGEGNYHVYRSFFSGSTVSDLHNSNCYYTSVRGCYSENSAAFSLDQGSSCNPFKRIFQDNMVLRPRLLPIEYYHLGKITLWGNHFDKTQVDPYPFSVNTKGWCPGNYEVLSLHNVYAYQHPIRIASGPQKLYAYADQDSTQTQPAPVRFQQSMVKTPPFVSRRIFELSRAADAAAIQATLDEAARLAGHRPIVHFPSGTYLLDRTLHIPSGADMQLIGDGLIDATVMTKKDKASFGSRPMLQVDGPSAVRIMDMQWGEDNGPDKSAAIVFLNADQPGAEVHIDQLSSHADTALIAQNLNYLYIEKDNSFFSSGNFLSGGRLQKQGKGESRVCCFGGQFAKLSVQDRAVFLAKDCWWEGNDRVPLNLTGSGDISIDGAMVAPQIGVDSTPTVILRNFTGRISLLNMYLQGALHPAEGLAGLKLLVWNVIFYHKMDVLDFLNKPVDFRGAFLGLNAECFDAKDPGCKSIRSIDDRQVNLNNVLTFLDDQTELTRKASPRAYRDLAPGVSNLFLSRVSTGSMNRGIVFTGQANPN
jgi:hypothetical protein